MLSPPPHPSIAPSRDREGMRERERETERKGREQDRKEGLEWRERKMTGAGCLNSAKNKQSHLPQCNTHTHSHTHKDASLQFPCCRKSVNTPLSLSNQHTLTHTHCSTLKNILPFLCQSQVGWPADTHTRTRRNKHREILTHTHQCHCNKHREILTHTHQCHCVSTHTFRNAQASHTMISS